MDANLTVTKNDITTNHRAAEHETWHSMLRVVLYTLEDKIRILKNKQKLRHTRDYYQVLFIRPEKSQTERIMEANNQALLEILPNGEMYNIASNGRIIRRSQQTDIEQTSWESYNNQRADVYSITVTHNHVTRNIGVQPICKV